MPEPPAHPTTVARLTTDEGTARRIQDALAESCDSETLAISIAQEPDGCWSLALHFRDRPDELALRALIASVAGQAASQDFARALARDLAFEMLAPTDWVRKSLEGLTPVEAGRFLVHGAHDRSRVGANRIAIQIEAALAFGTGHHASTRGCLLALDRIMKRDSRKRVGWAKARPRNIRAWAKSAQTSLRSLRKLDCAAPSPRLQGRQSDFVHPTSGCPKASAPSRGGTRRDRDIPPRLSRKKAAVLDIGTGTGVLAIAAAKALHQPVVASDIDARAVAIARDNTRINRVAASVEVVHAAGVGARRFLERSPFALIFANILLEPLEELATPIAKLVAPNGRVVLSGLLNAQGAAALASYRARGLALAQRIALGGWTTLVLVRPSRGSGRALRETQRLRKRQHCWEL
jgi:ribosomal protein L11 methyltransferase